MLAFVGVCPDRCEVLHLDHNPANNALTNLKYGTRGENVTMDYDVGTRKRKPVTATFDSGRIEMFPSVTIAAVVLGVCQSAVSKALLLGSRLRRPGAHVCFEGIRNV